MTTFVTPSIAYEDVHRLVGFRVLPQSITPPNTTKGLYWDPVAMKVVNGAQLPGCYAVALVPNVFALDAFVPALGLG
jgi:hypothetical protein